MKRSRKKGFTLIEILVVLVIISIVTSVTVLAIGDFGRTRKLYSNAQQLALYIPMLSQKAMLEPSTIGIKLENDRYSFYQFIYDEQSNGGVWQELHDSLLKTVILPPGTYLHIERIHDSEINATLSKGEKPDIVLSPSGEMTPFEIMMGIDILQSHYRIIGYQDSTVEIVDLSK